MQVLNNNKNTVNNQYQPGNPECIHSPKPAQTNIWTQTQSAYITFKKSLCNFFTPYRQYFSTYPVEYIQQPEPTYLEKQPYQEKTQLSIEKQLQYFRGGWAKDYIGDGLLGGILKQEMRTTGFVSAYGVRSLFIHYGPSIGVFLYTEGSWLKSIYLQTGANLIKNTSTFSQTQQADDYKTLPKNRSINMVQQIFQLKQVQKDSKDIIIRCRYWLYVYNVDQNRISTEIRFREEITAVGNKLGSANAVLVTTYSDKQYHIYQITFPSFVVSLDRTSTSIQPILIQSLPSQTPITNLLPLNPREFIFNLQNKLAIYDVRAKSNHNMEILRTVNDIGYDRFVGMCFLNELLPNQVVLSRWKFVDLVDLRMPRYSLVSYRHHCQQAPPSVLIPLLWLNQPIILAQSSCPLGSSLLLCPAPKPCLLYDSGKYYKGIHPKSLTPVINPHNNSILQVVHVDSSNGIAVEYLLGNMKEEKDDIYIQIQHLRTKRMNGGYPEDPGKRWREQKELEPYLKVNKFEQDQQSQSESSEQEQQIQQEQSQQSQDSQLNLLLQHCQNTHEPNISMFQRKNTYCTLDKFREKIHQLTDNQVSQTKQKDRHNQEKRFHQLNSALNPNSLKSTIDIGSVGQLDEPENWVDVVKFTGNAVNANGQKSNINIVSQEMLQLLQKNWKI